MGLGVGSIGSFVAELWDVFGSIVLAVVWAICVAVVACAGIAIVGALAWLLISRAERTVAKHANTIVPATFALFSALGAASASAVDLPKGVAFALAGLVTGMMFVSAVVRQRRGGGSMAKILGSIGLVLSPAAAIGYVLSVTDLAGLSVEEWFVLGASALILVAAAVAGFVLRRGDGLVPA
jgi:hypothetical protein